MYGAFGITVLSFLCCSNVKTSDAGEWPVGHMMALGSHKLPSVKINEYTVENTPTPEEFFNSHVKSDTAAIFRGAISESDAFQLWTDDYIRAKFGDMEVRLESKLEGDFLAPIGEKYLGRDTIRHFVDHYHDETSMTYIISDLPEVMYPDVGVVPSLGACGEMSRHLVEIDIWWSGGGSRSKLHKDAYNQMNCLLNGTKYWKLIENKYEKYIYKHPEPEFEFGGFSDIDPEKVDLIQYPNVANVEWSKFTINAGDCLYLPKGYYHQVDSTGTHNLAVSILFGRFDGREYLDFSDCNSETDYRHLRRLSEFEVQWAWKGFGDMVMGSPDLEDVCRKKLLQSVRESRSRGEHLTFEAFKDEFPLHEYEFYINFKDPYQGFKAIDKNGDGELTEDEVKELDLEDLRQFAKSIEQYEPSSSYNFEYSMISYGEVRRKLKHVTNIHEVINRDTWINAYKALGGTEEFGDEIFSRLCGSSPVVVSKQVSREDLAYALENWKAYLVPQYSDESKMPSDDYDENASTDGEYHDDNTSEPEGRVDGYSEDKIFLAEGGNGEKEEL